MNVSPGPVFAAHEPPAARRGRAEPASPVRSDAPEREARLGGPPEGEARSVSGVGYTYSLQSPT